MISGHFPDMSNVEVELWHLIKSETFDASILVINEWAEMLLSMAGGGNDLKLMGFLSLTSSSSK